MPSRIYQERKNDSEKPLIPRENSGRKNCTYSLKHMGIRIKGLPQVLAYLMQVCSKTSIVTQGSLHLSLPHTGPTAFVSPVTITPTINLRPAMPSVDLLLALRARNDSCMLGGKSEEWALKCSSGYKWKVVPRGLLLRKIPLVKVVGTRKSGSKRIARIRHESLQWQMVLWGILDSLERVNGNAVQSFEVDPDMVIGGQILLVFIVLAFMG
ncbi:hypothetical protein F4604DRAFT_1685901 [Suillus subluteus]|nr:hypothetical protein F4604DRAFT_1685901 [Suillus subluteus]